MADMARLVECLPQGEAISHAQAVKLITSAAGRRSPLPAADANSIARGHIESLVYYGLVRRLGGGLTPDLVRVPTADVVKAHENPQRRSTAEAILDEWGNARDYLRGSDAADNERKRVRAVLLRRDAAIRQQGASTLAELERQGF